MEYGQFLALLSNYLPSSIQGYSGFKTYLAANPKLLAEYADTFVLTLPAPRTRYYESVNYDDTQRIVTKYANDVTDALGYYPVTISLDVLKDMQGYASAVLFMGLIFDIIILLFVIIAILLIYSLLMISVETKTFEMGVIRMVGLSKLGITAMVFLQGLYFVFPAIVLGFIFCSPFLKVIYGYLFTDDLGIEQQVAPDGFAVL
jgi:ABC-type antimicrobial peptide transport system permease subunit